MIALRHLFRRQDGATAIEYALIAGLISVMIIGGATSIGISLDSSFQGVNAGFPN